MRRKGRFNDAEASPPTEFVSLPIQGTRERGRTCAYCEYFDGGGLNRVLAARAGEKVHGDCLSGSSPRFTTDSDDTCPAFVPDTSAETWPLGNGVAS